MAILLLSLPEEAASEILRRLDRTAVEDVVKEIASIGQVSSETCNLVVDPIFR